MDTEIVTVGILVTDASGQLVRVNAGDLENLVTRRKRISQLERDFLWKSTEGKCYICQVELPLKSDWHVEHIIAFSKDKAGNDVIGNMLPSCSTCNLRKNTKELENIVKEGIFPTNIMTAAASVQHLSDAAKSVIKRSLEAKHRRGHYLTSDYTPENLAKLVLRMNADLNSNQKMLSHDDQEEFLKEITENRNVLDKNDISLLKTRKRLGTGGFGGVFAATYLKKDPSMHKAKSIRVAIKVVSYEIATLRELLFLDRFRHDNIVTYHGYYRPSESRIGIVLERCDLSLMDHVDENHKAISLVNPFKIIFQVSQALDYMHSYQCIHRDVKPANILLVKPRNGKLFDAKAKLCDFGTAKPVLMDLEVLNTKNPSSTDDYCCPEARRGIAGPFTDAFSLGQTMLNFIASNGQGLDAEVSRDWLLLAQQMKSSEPKCRPSMMEVASKMKELSEKATAASGTIKSTWNVIMNVKRIIPIPDTKAGSELTSEGVAYSSASTAEPGREERPSIDISTMPMLYYLTCCFKKTDAAAATSPPPSESTNAQLSTEASAKTATDIAVTSPPPAESKKGRPSTKASAKTATTPDAAAATSPSPSESTNALPSTEASAKTATDVADMESILSDLTKLSLFSGLNRVGEDCEDESDDIPVIDQVYVSPNARRLENPKGHTKQSYHLREKCYSENILVDLTDALMYSHKVCAVCLKKMKY